MARTDDLDAATRARVVAHLRQKMAELGLSMNATASVLGLAPATLSKVLSGQRNPGLAFVVQIHRKLHIDLNRLVDVDPPRVWFDEESLPRGAAGRPRLHPVTPRPRPVK